jgi:hypothetical protein
MKKIIIAIGVLILAACGNSTSQNKQSEFNDEGFKKVNVDFLAQEILIPNNYVEISPDELQEKLLEVKKETKFINAVKGGIEKLKLMPTEFVIYTDRENFENCFWIQSGEYVDFDKNIASQYIGMLEKQVSQDWSNLGLDYERLEKRFLKTGKSKIIKVKYRQEYDGQEKYQTQYIVTSNYKTFGIVVSNYEDVDFEEIVKRI